MISWGNNHKSAILSHSDLHGGPFTNLAQKIAGQN